ncbi:hypothetical protein TNIN_178511 [Trichonephila inaurata madagascariensis]|uniref:Uncharacterized protein n=1 Tax=Trichonephila inaurata madagascariensis TaxID=2747483 RepID=A0A8X7C8L7_9ARAC|nr:hypothetical protein TNIN_178511 [Trichonephila inaurata madagascariensis]
MDRYSSSTAFVVQNLPCGDNHLSAKIALFARGRGASVPRAQNVRYTSFVYHRSRACRRSCFRSNQNSLFHFWHSCISQMSGIAVSDGKRIGFWQSSSNIGKNRMTRNTTS